MPATHNYPLARPRCTFFSLFTPTPTTEIYTLSLHDALPICYHQSSRPQGFADRRAGMLAVGGRAPEFTLPDQDERSEEHTSELQSRGHLVCRLLLEKKKDSS